MKINKVPGRVLCNRRSPGPQALSRWAINMVVALLLTSGIAMAQSPFLVIDPASVFEGNSGTTLLKFPVRFVGTQNSTVTGTVSVIPLTGGSFNTPIGGASCGGNVDFQTFTNVPFAFPPNTPNGSLSFNITVCGDTTVEPNEQVVVFVSNVTGAYCAAEDPCNAIGTIANDDGEPNITINSISVSTIPGISKTALFTVSLQHPTVSPVSVHFATRDGTAKARSLTNAGSYIITSGTLTIPPNTLSGTIPVTLLGTGGGTFFMDLSSSSNGIITEATGQCTIRPIDLTIGSVELTPDDARVAVGERTNYSLTWTVPDGEVWRNLNSIDFRIGRGDQTALWLHWNENANTLSLCQRNEHGLKHGIEDDDDADDDSPNCTAGVPPGSGGVLETPFARLYLANSSVVGSGPTGPSVTLNLSISFLKNAASHLYRVELAATDDFGRRDAFVEATTVHVEKAPRH